MNSDTTSASGPSLLRRFMQRRATSQTQCELCSAPLVDEHFHLVELASRRLCCTCEPCAILFSNPAAPKYRRVPRRVAVLGDFRMTDVDWASFQVPIGLAFFLHSTPANGIVALYPSPAGATETFAPPEAWAQLVADNPSLTALEKDVEALLVNRLGWEAEHYLVGVDICYALVGLVRTRWRGMTGGKELWQEMGRFFSGLKQRAGDKERDRHA